ncbi:hypothetical protein BSLA_02r3499 [Burkholderia stabilis]|nr:hypothetical protein BSLA_02r3499 [Burkholderia stabilis]
MIDSGDFFKSEMQWRRSFRIASFMKDDCAWQPRAWPRAAAPPDFWHHRTILRDGRGRARRRPGGTTRTTMETT